MSIIKTPVQPSANDPHDWFEQKTVRVLVVVTGNQELTQEQVADRNMAEMHQQGLILGWEVSALPGSPPLTKLQECIDRIYKAPSNDRILTARGIACGYMSALIDEGILGHDQHEPLLDEIERVTNERRAQLEAPAATAEA